MNKFLRKIREMSGEEVNHLISVFVASVLGSLGTTLFLMWATDGIYKMAWFDRLAVTVLATLLYAAIVVLSFYIFSPHSRPALKRLLMRDRN